MMKTTPRTVLFAATFAVAVPGLALGAQQNQNETLPDEGGQVIIQGEQRQQGQQDQDQQRQQRQDRSRQAQQAGQQSGQQAQELNEQQLQQWFEHAASGNRFEIESAELAKERVQDDQQFTQLADTLIQGHERAQQQLRRQAQQAGVDISEEPDLTPVHEAQLDALREKQGEEFKRAWLFGQDAAHRQTALMYSWAQSNVQNPEVKAYVSSALPSIQQHSARIEQMASQMAGMERDAQMAGARMGGEEDPDRDSRESDRQRPGQQQRPGQDRDSDRPSPRTPGATPGGTSGGASGGMGTD